MINAYYKDLSQDIYKDQISGEKIKGGFGIPDYHTIYIDENLPVEQQPLVIIHEVQNIYLHKRIRHQLLDTMAIDIIDALFQLGFEIRKV